MEAWLVLWLEDLFADLLAVTLLCSLVGKCRRSDPPIAARRLELVSGWLAALILIYFAFSATPRVQYVSLFGLYLLVPVTIWAAVRTGFRGTTLMLTVMTAAAGFWSMNGVGPFAGVQSGEVGSVLGLISYLTVVTTTGLLLEGFVADQARYATDVTARLSREQQLRREDAYFRDLFEVILDGALIIDASEDHGRILWANQAAARMHGYTVDEIVGRSIVEISGRRDASLFKDRMERLVRGDRLQFEVEHRRKDGSTLPVEVSAARIQYANRACIIGINRDITERRAAEERQRNLSYELENRVHERTAELQAANRELEAFCHSVAHDLRAPLRSIEGFSQAVTEEFTGPLPGQSADFLERIRQAATRMGKQIDALLNLSRLTRCDMLRKTVDLTAASETIAADLRQHFPERSVSVAIEPGLSVVADQHLIYTVMENLIANAWKYTARRTDALIEVGKLDRPGRPVFFVRDNGAGFDMRFKDRLFGVFQRLHNPAEFPGVGVGLASVYRVIKRHGGEVWFEAEVNKGATFYFTI